MSVCSVLVRSCSITVAGISGRSVHTLPVEAKFFACADNFCEKIVKVDSGVVCLFVIMFAPILVVTSHPLTLEHWSRGDWFVVLHAEGDNCRGGRNFQHTFPFRYVFRASASENERAFHVGGELDGFVTGRAIRNSPSASLPRALASASTAILGSSRV